MPGATIWPNILARVRRLTNNPLAWHSRPKQQINEMKTTKSKQAPLAGESFNTKEIGLADNAEPRCACIILADRSGSMSGSPISAVNTGLKLLKTTLADDALACLRVELALVSFNETATVDVDFCSPENFTPPTLGAGGGTNLGSAILFSLKKLNARRAEYIAAGSSFYRPWFIVLTDAASGDDLSEAGRLIKEAEMQKRLAFFGVGVRGADMKTLAKLSNRPPQLLDGLKFPELFEWLSVNLGSVAVSRPGDQVPLTPPNWATV